MSGSGLEKLLAKPNIEKLFAVLAGSDSSDSSSDDGVSSGDDDLDIIFENTCLKNRNQSLFEITRKQGNLGFNDSKSFVKLFEVPLDQDKKNKQVNNSVSPKKIKIEDGDNSNLTKEESYNEVNQNLHTQKMFIAHKFSKKPERIFRIKAHEKFIRHPITNYDVPRAFIYKCDLCPVVRKNRISLDLHMQTHADPPKSELECGICGRLLTTLSSAVRHYVIHDTNWKYQCEICGQRFRCNASLQSHGVVHTDKRPFECSVCKKAFKVKRHLAVHMFIHTGKNNFICSICGKGFPARFMLRSHFKVHDIPLHICKFCNVQFSNEDEYERHMEIEIKKRAQIQANKPKRKSVRKPKKKNKTVTV